MNDLATSRRWNYLTGSASNLTFVAGLEQPVEVTVSTGNNYATHLTEPDVLHQAAEVQFRFDTNGTGAGSFTGVFVKAQDLNAMVLLLVDHSTRVAKLYERQGGVDTLVLTHPDAAPADVTGGAVRLEVIGNRARVWYEPHFQPVPDSPPDTAVTLTGTYGDTGQWGFYCAATDGGNTIRVARFKARELPATVLAPPQVKVQAASGLNLTPITASISGVNAATYLIEWEVYPADPDDFAEAYKDVALATNTNRVFWVRPGYAYTVRCRELLKTGGKNGWHTQEILAAGTKVAPGAPTLPDDEFPVGITPDYVLSRTQTAAATVAVSDTGRERVRATQLRPPEGFTLEFRNRTKDELQKLVDFFDEMQGGNRLFKWVHPTSGQQFVMRFAADEYELTYNDQSIDDEPIGDLVFQITEGKVGGAGTLPVALTLRAGL